MKQAALDDIFISLGLAALFVWVLTGNVSDGDLWGIVGNIIGIVLALLYCALRIYHFKQLGKHENS